MHTTETPVSAGQLLTAKVPIWLRYAVIALMVAGVFFRFVNLGQKVYWTDEALTSLRSSGHTKVEFVEEQFTGEVISPETVMHYQSLEPENGWGHTLAALMGNAEHTPLYFLGVRGWMELFGSGSGAVRSLSAVLGVLAFPCVFWLALELFQSQAAAWVSLGLFAITPLHILYAQEARPYSLWTLCILLSSAALLRAMRVRSWQSWAIYGLSLALGLYTQLLFALVAIAHALYVIGIEQILHKRRLTDKARAYALSAGAALLSLSPWVVLLVVRADRIRDTTASLSQVTSLEQLINRWFLALSRAFVGIDLAAANGL
ncbi:MAG: glycosyltransferase family 39 protein, partial [Cyanobacteriota bacterium]